MTVRLEVSDPSGVGHARRSAAELARTTGLDDRQSATLALVVTELATNLVKHAGHGEILLDRVAGPGPAVEVMAVDSGPGIARIADALRDAYSTAGSPGLGLGSIGRLSSGFDMHTSVGGGTVLRTRIGDAGLEARVLVGAVCVAKAGETVAGDAWGIIDRPAGVRVMVADGVGHGADAATAANEAVRVLRAHPDLPLPDLLHVIHERLRSGRGAAIAVADVDLAEGRVAYVGIGNIVGVIAAAGVAQRNLVSHPGTAGHEMHRVQVFEDPLPAGALLVMHSDGARARWSLDAYPGIHRRHPSVVAGLLYRDFVRGTDDVTVVALRARP